MAEKIGQILIRKGKISAEQLREALRTQEFFGGYLGSHLINLGFLDEPTLGETLSEIFRVPYAPYDSIRVVRKEVLSRIPAALAQRYRVVPIQIEGNRLHLAMLNPRDAQAVSEVARTTGLNVTTWVAPEFRIIQALEKHYKIRKPGRKPIKVGDEAGGIAKILASAPAPAEASKAPGEYRHVDKGAIGLDGHPLGAVVVPNLGGGDATRVAEEPLPRSLDEWREMEDGSGMKRRKSDLQTAAQGGGHASQASVAPGKRGPARAKSAPAVEPQPSPPAPAEPAPLGLEQLADLLTSAPSRDDVAREAVLFLAGSFRRAAAFSVRQDVATGWIGAGEGWDPGPLRSVAVPLEGPSIFSPVLGTQTFYVGPLPGNAGFEDVRTLLGDVVPPDVLMLPVMIRERLVTILYADNASDALGPIDDAVWKRLARMMEVAFEIIILKNKMKQI